jgi:hypothetical protein
MASRTIWRVWYGRSLGIKQSFEDIGNVEAVANFAAHIQGDRIEVIHEPIVSLSVEDAA